MPEVASSPISEAPILSPDFSIIASFSMSYPFKTDTHISILKY